MPVTETNTFFGSGSGISVVTDPNSGNQLALNVNGDIATNVSDPVTGTCANVANFGLAGSQNLAATAQLLVAALNLVFDGVNYAPLRGVNGASAVTDANQALLEPSMGETLSAILVEFKTMNSLIRQLPAASGELPEDDPWIDNDLPPGVNS